MGEGLQVTNFDQCLHTVMVIRNCGDLYGEIFLVERLRGGVYEGGSSLEGNLSRRREIA